MKTETRGQNPEARHQTTDLSIPVRERPMLFSGAMVRAILDGSKNQTRRAVKNDLGVCDACWREACPNNPIAEDADIFAPYLSVGYCEHNEKCGKRVAPRWSPGERIWVKETFATFRQKTKSEQRKAEAVLKGFFDGKYKSEAEIVNKALEIPHGTGGLGVLYAADFGEWAYDKAADLGPWKPSIFMRRIYSRITLEITSIRAERLQEISEEDAVAEGCCVKLNGHDDDFARNCYRKLWETINGAGSWDLNPWVWVVGFRNVEGRRQNEETGTARRESRPTSDGRMD